MSVSDLFLFLLSPGESCCLNHWPAHRRRVITLRLRCCWESGIVRSTESGMRKRDTRNTQRRKLTIIVITLNLLLLHGTSE